MMMGISRMVMISGMSGMLGISGMSEQSFDETHNSGLEKQSKAEVKYYKYVSYIPLYDTSIVNLKMLSPKLTIARS